MNFQQHFSISIIQKLFHSLFEEFPTVLSPFQFHSQKFPNFSTSNLRNSRPFWIHPNSNPRYSQPSSIPRIPKHFQTFPLLIRRIPSFSQHISIPIPGIRNTRSPKNYQHFQIQEFPTLSVPRIPNLTEFISIPSLQFQGSSRISKRSRSEFQTSPPPFIPSQIQLPELPKLEYPNKMEHPQNRQHPTSTKPLIPKTVSRSRPTGNPRRTSIRTVGSKGCEPHCPRVTTRQRLRRPEEPDPSRRSRSKHPKREQTGTRMT